MNVEGSLLAYFPSLILLIGALYGAYRLSKKQKPDGSLRHTIAWFLILTIAEAIVIFPIISVCERLNFTLGFIGKALLLFDYIVALSFLPIAFVLFILVGAIYFFPSVRDEGKVK